MLDPSCVLPFTESSIHYPFEDFEDLDYDGRICNFWMISETWESLNIDLTTRLSRLVTGITLFLGMMIATSNKILKDAHTEGLLDSLVSALLVSCGYLASFGIHIATFRYCPEDVSNDAIEERTITEQWKVVGYILDLVTRLVAGLEELKYIFLSIELNDSQEFLPHLVPAIKKTGIAIS